MATLDLTPTEMLIKVLVTNDKVLTAGPYYRSGVIIPRTGKRLRFIVKARRTTADADALIDINAVDDPTLVTTQGADATGVWLVDIRDNTLPVQTYHYRVDMSADSSPDTDRETVGLGALQIIGA